MAFQLKPGESVQKGIRRIVRSELEDARADLKQAESSDEAVHGARKRFKRLRAVVRLVRDALGEERYREENSCFRDAARPLTEVRDAKVLIEAFDNLIKHSVEQEPDAAGSAEIIVLETLPPDAISAVREGLERHRSVVRACVLEQEHSGAAATQIVEQAIARLRDCKITGLRWSVLRRAMKRAYKKSQRAYRIAVEQQTTPNFHEWRKQAKYLWHQIELVERIRPRVMKKLAGRVHELTQLLGDDHDLAILRETLSADPESFGGNAALQSLFPPLERRRAKLQRDAIALEQQIFAATPKRFIRRIDRYWKRW
jgi:CHAD domain-containing protein